MNGQEFNEIIPEPVDNPVIPHNQLTNVRGFLLRDYSTEFGKMQKPFNRCKHVEGKQAGVLGRVLRNEFSDGLQIISRLESPSYFSHSAIFSLTWR